MKKHMILVLPAAIFLHSQFLVSYLTCQGRSMERRITFFLLSSCFQILFVINAWDTNDIGKSWCFAIFWIFFSKSCGQVDDKECTRATAKVISMLMAALSSELWGFGSRLGSVCKRRRAAGAAGAAGASQGAVLHYHSHFAPSCVGSPRSRAGLWQCREL